MTQSRCLELREAAPTTLVRVYTFQHRDAYAGARERGYFTGSPEHALEDDPWGATEQYEWMRGEMAKRIPGFTGEYPMWAYLTRPNLRQTSYHADSVLIVADIPRQRMLVSDHSAWHLPLNRWYVTATEEEDDRLRETEGRINYMDEEPRLLSAAMKESWERIFEIGAPSNPVDRKWLGPRDDLQACIDRIYLGEIVRVTNQPGRIGKRGGGRFRPLTRSAEVQNAESQP